MKTYEGFVIFAGRRLHKKQPVVEFMIQCFLRKYRLTKKTIECYLNWNNGYRTQHQIAKILRMKQRTVSFHLSRLRKICPELFVVRRPHIPDIPWMVHLTSEQWRIVSEQELITEKF